MGEFYWDAAAEDVTSSMESLDAFVDCTDQRHSNSPEVVQESGNDNNDVDNNDAENKDEQDAIIKNVDDDDEQNPHEVRSVNVDDDVGDDEENIVDKDKLQLQIPSNAIEEKSNKMKIWFEKIYSKGVKFSPKFTP